MQFRDEKQQKSLEALNGCVIGLIEQLVIWDLAG
jgi:hypothetical protein